MRVKILKVDKRADIPYQAHALDYCVDLTATRMEKIGDNTYKYYLGIALQIDRKWSKELISPAFDRRDDGLYGDFSISVKETSLDMQRSPLKLALKLYPRSSCYKHGMILVNSTAIIDEGYTGEISVIFYHYDTSLPPYKEGEKVCQMALEAGLPIDFSSAVILDETDRGSNGYGSSGD